MPPSTTYPGTHERFEIQWYNPLSGNWNTYDAKEVRKNKWEPHGIHKTSESAEAQFKRIIKRVHERGRKHRIIKIVSEAEIFLTNNCA